MESDLSEKEAVIAAIEKKRPELDHYLNRSDWKILEEKEDYKLYYCDEESGLRSIKSEIVIDKPLKEVFDYVSDFSNKAKYDHSFEIGQNVTTFDDHYLLQYYKYKGKLLFSPRDFFVACYRNYTDDFAEFFCTNFASDKHPPFKKIERAELKLGGFQFKKIEDSKTHVLYYTLGDMHINQTLVNTTLKEVALQVKYLRDLLMKK